MYYALEALSIQRWAFVTYLRKYLLFVRAYMPNFSVPIDAYRERERWKATHDDYYPFNYYMEYSRSKFKSAGYDIN